MTDRPSPLPPAVVVAGPPHSGKSVFAYHLNRLLRERPLAFYHLGATPDGEGHWSQRVPPLERLLWRRKGEFTPAFAAAMARTLRQRELPLLVDVGGRISAENRQIMAEATHAIVLAADPVQREAWRAFCADCGLRLLAELDSVEHGTGWIAADLPGEPLRGQLGGLARGALVDGPLLHAVADRVAHLLATTPTPLTDPPATEVDLMVLAERLTVPVREWRFWWEPATLPAAVAALPAGPVALFNSGPLWLFAALLLAAPPAGRWCYNARSGWHRITPLPCQAEPAAPDGFRWSHRAHPSGATWLAYERPEIVTAAQVAGLTLPALDLSRGLVIEGRGPNWLSATIAASYSTAPWVALFDANTRVAVVVRGSAAMPLGSILAR